MNSGLELVRLRCQKCSADLSGRDGEIFLYCSSCGSGYELDDQEQLQPTTVYFARAQATPQSFLPFWIFDARLELQEREAKSGITSLFGNSKGLIRVFEERKTIRFYVAGFASDLEEKKSMSLQFTYDQPELEFIKPLEKVERLELHQNDARKIADVLFLTSEIEQRDMLRSLRYKLELENPSVIVIGV
jgi:hypothetical protein